MRPYSLPFGGWVYRRGGAGSLEVSRFSLFYTHKLRFYTLFQGVFLRSELLNLAGPYITPQQATTRQQCPPFSFPRVSSLLLSCPLVSLAACLPSSCVLLCVLVCPSVFFPCRFLSLLCCCLVCLPVCLLASCVPSCRRSCLGCWCSVCRCCGPVLS